MGQGLLGRPRVDYAGFNDGAKSPGNTTINDIIDTC